LPFAKGGIEALFEKVFIEPIKAKFRLLVANSHSDGRRPALIEMTEVGRANPPLPLRPTSVFFFPQFFLENHMIFKAL
jgi:hypothetical protein